MSQSPADFNATIIEEFRSNGGLVGGMFECDRKQPRERAF